MRYPKPRSRAQRLRALLYLLAQHPTRGHAALVRRGLSLSWLSEFAAFANEPGIPVDNFAGFQAMRYHYARRYGEAREIGVLHDDNRYSYEAARCMLYSFIWRRELHPLRWLPWAWALRGCQRVLEYGAGSAPLAHGMTRAWPFRLPEIHVADIDWVLSDYCRWRFLTEPSVKVYPVTWIDWFDYDGIVCTETFEHLPEPMKMATNMMAHAKVVVFDYVEDAGEAAGREQREEVLVEFAACGRLTGPDPRGTYVWRRG